MQFATSGPTVELVVDDLNFDAVKTRLSNNAIVGDTVTAVVRAYDAFGNAAVHDNQDAVAQTNCTDATVTAPASFDRGVFAAGISSTSPLLCSVSVSLLANSSIRAEANVQFYLDGNVEFVAWPAVATVGTSVAVDIAVRDRAGNILPLDTDIVVAASRTMSGTGTVRIISGEGTVRLATTVSGPVELSLQDPLSSGYSIANTTSFTFLAGKTTHLCVCVHEWVWVREKERECVCVSEWVCVGVVVTVRVVFQF